MKCFWLLMMVSFTVSASPRNLSKMETKTLLDSSLSLSLDYKVGEYTEHESVLDINPSGVNDGKCKTLTRYLLLESSPEFFKFYSRVYYFPGCNQPVEEAVQEKVYITKRFGETPHSFYFNKDFKFESATINGNIVTISGIFQPSASPSKHPEYVSDAIDISKSYFSRNVSQSGTFPRVMVASGLTEVNLQDFEHIQVIDIR